ncbi:MAG: AMP-binding protein [Bacteroidales bacterium]|nr:AMP-binding protein [Bacteroidales bacterium]
MKYKTEREFHKNFLLKEGDYRSIREMLGRINRMIPQKVLLAELDAGNNMVEYTAQNIYNEVMALGEGLVAEGLKGAHIAIVSENCCRYVIADISISSGVGVVVPVDVNSPDNLMATLLQKSDADAVLCGADLVELMEQMQQCCPRLKKIITLDRKVAGYPSYEEIVGKGKTLDGKYRNVELDLDAPAKILFTSGTTGANKGVVLTNANLAANMVNCMDSIMTAGDTTSMSVLPMHHATEINTHIMTRIGSGRLTYVNGNMRNLMKNMKIFKPHVITVVPMIANAFYRNIQAGVKKAGKEEKLQKGIKLSNMLRKIGIDRTHKMFADLFVPFGGNLNMIVCGGSMLNPVVIKGMNDLGVRMENGYGITECGPLISINGDTLSEHLSVGKPCPGLQVKIASPDADGIGDLCVKGKSVFKEYYKDPEATAAVFDEEGFFNTGDSARIDSKGRIFLVGRKKNTIVLENGKNVCPEEIENVIETNMGYADEIAVYQAELKVGNVSRSVICAGIFIKDEQERGNRRAIEADMERINALLPDYKRIEYVELPSSEYRKTSSRKIIRKNLPQNCSGEGILLM